jgi:hypothetical protein
MDLGFVFYAELGVNLSCRVLSDTEIIEKLPSPDKRFLS